jgi:hypothetical protein
MRFKHGFKVVEAEIIRFTGGIAVWKSGSPREEPVIEAETAKGLSKQGYTYK